MPKATVRSHNGIVTVEVEAGDVKGLFEKVSEVMDAFDAATKCGACNGTYLKYVARQNQGYKFYELLCLACFARLQFGQKKEGGALFARRKDDDGKPLPNHGWTKWEGGEEEAKKVPVKA